jgi:hypothetical protein
MYASTYVSPFSKIHGTVITPSTTAYATAHPRDTHSVDQHYRTVHASDTQSAARMNSQGAPGILRAGGSKASSFSLCDITHGTSQPFVGNERSRDGPCVSERGGVKPSPPGNIRTIQASPPQQQEAQPQGQPQQLTWKKSARKMVRPMGSVTASTLFRKPRTTNSGPEACTRVGTMAVCACVSVCVREQQTWAGGGKSVPQEGKHEWTGGVCAVPFEAEDYRRCWPHSPTHPLTHSRQ